MAQGKILLNLGCGTTAPANWMNCDSSLHAQISKIPFMHSVFRVAGLVGGAEWPKNIDYVSLNNPFPWADSSIDCVYASHVLEHLRVKTANNFLKESYRVLKPGGTLRIVVPDLLYHARRYLDNYTNAKSASADFLQTLHLQIPEEMPFLSKLINFFSDYPTIHKYMYDPATLRKLFSAYGFKDHNEAQYGRSLYIDCIAEVEAGEEVHVGSIYLEAKK